MTRLLRIGVAGLVLGFLVLFSLLFSNIDWQMKWSVRQSNRYLRQQELELTKILRDPVSEKLLKQEPLSKAEGNAWTNFRLPIASFRHQDPLSGRIICPYTPVRVRFFGNPAIVLTCFN